MKTPAEIDMRPARVMTGSEVAFYSQKVFLKLGLMSTQEILLEEIKRQPEPGLREICHYLKFLTRQREEEAWADVLPTREVEQEVFDILDGHVPAPR